MAMYRNATPNMYFTGVKDSPKPGLQSGSVSTPLLLPLCPIVAAWGPVGYPVLCMGSEYVDQFGAESFNVRGKFYNHQTVLSKMFQSKGNAQYPFRLKLPDMQEAVGRLCIEFVQYKVPQFLRNPDGSFQRDSDNGQPKRDSDKTVQGYKWRLVVVTDDVTIGEGTEKTGTLEGDDSQTARILPLFDFKATYMGSRGNQFGINIFQPKAFDPVAVDLDSIKQNGDMIYRMFISETPVKGGSATPWYNKMGGEHMDFAFGDNVFNVKGAEQSFEPVYEKMFITSGQAYDGLNISGPIDIQHVYHENAAEVAGLFYDAETKAENRKSFLHPTNKMSMNIMGDTDMMNVPYHAQVMATTEEFTESTYLPIEGSVMRLAKGSDGEINKKNVEAAVVAMVDSFGKASPNLCDLRRFPFHAIFDTGFEVATKLKLQSLMGKRPDLAVFVATFEDGKPLNTITNELAIASQLSANASLFPESVIYKTPSTRGVIVPWAIKLEASHEYKKPVSLVYDLAEKCSDYWGSSDGVWDPAKAIDTYPNNVIQRKLLNYEYAQFSVREEAWGSQMIAVEYGDTNEVIYSGLQTVNPNDSSILNGVINMFGTIHATWACIRANRKFQGQAIEPGLLIKRSNDEVTLLTKGVDAQKCVITPDTQITPEDNDTGYAYTTKAHVAGHGMMTVNTIEISSGFMESTGA